MSVSRNQDRRGPITPDRYAAIHQGFGWKVPKRFNMAQACCGQWAAQPATARRVAIREHVAGQGLGQSWTFAQLQTAANRLSRVLQAQGVVRGDRVAIVLPQRFETAVAYMAVLQMGAVAMPLSMLFGPEALAYRPELIEELYVTPTALERYEQFGRAALHSVRLARDGKDRSGRRIGWRIQPDKTARDGHGRDVDRQARSSIAVTRGEPPPDDPHALRLSMPPQRRRQIGDALSTVDGGCLGQSDQALARLSLCCQRGLGGGNHQGLTSDRKARREQGEIEQQAAHQRHHR